MLFKYLSKVISQLSFLLFYVVNMETNTELLSAVKIETGNTSFIIKIFSFKASQTFFFLKRQTAGSSDFFN